MDNLTSSPQLVFPNVPDDFCPSGSWTDVLQSFIDDVLANGTVNVPGLGDVNPEQISKLNEQVQSLQNEVESIDLRVDSLETRENVEVRFGTLTGISSGDTTTIGITFSSQFPTANYGVSLTPIYSSGTPASTPLFTLVSGTKTTSGFTIRVDNNIASITSLDWMAVHTS